MRFLLAISSAVLLILSFPNFEISALAWFALIPLLFVIKESPPAKSFIFSYITGAVFFAGCLYWLTYITKLGYSVLILYLSLFFALFGLLANIFFRRFKGSRLSFLLCMIIPSLWVFMEFLRGVVLTGFPWCMLGYTQYKNTLLIQIADITGAYGVSFLIVMSNVVIGTVLERDRYGFGSRTVPIFLLAIALSLSVGYGYLCLKDKNNATGIRLSVIQGSIEQFKKWDPAYKDYILNTYISLTGEAAKNGADLIIWPETAIPGFIDEYDIEVRLQNLMQETGIPLFSGVVTYKYEGELDYFFNSAVLFSADGTIRQQYDKIHLVPFGEYIPFESKIPFFRRAIDKEMGSYTSGKEFIIFEITKEGVSAYKYGALICFEDIFPDLARCFVSEGADFLINITNDAWFMESSEQLQHAQASVFRAVENRCSVIRAANNGFSCYINPKGVIEDYIGKDGGSIYDPGFKTFELKIKRSKTFYSTYGDVFVGVCLLLVGYYFLIPPP